MTNDKDRRRTADAGEEKAPVRPNVEAQFDNRHAMRRAMHKLLKRLETK